MNNLSADNVERETQFSKTIYTQTQAIIDAMPTDGDGRRMQIKEMAEAVGLAIGEEPKEVLFFVNRYAHHAVGGYVTRGKKGGFIKGVRPVKEVAPVIVPSADPVVSDAE